MQAAREGAGEGESQQIVDMSINKTKFAIWDNCAGNALQLQLSQQLLLLLLL